MEQAAQPYTSHLFMVRVWQEQLDEGEFEWRGRVQDSATGEASYFRDWRGLETALERFLESKGDVRAEAPGQ
jgi:hypothetical protein